MIYTTAIIMVKNSGQKRKKTVRKTPEERRIQENIWIAQFGVYNPEIKKKGIAQRNRYRFKKANCYLKGYSMLQKRNLMVQQHRNLWTKSRVYWTIIKMEDGEYINVRTSDLIERVSLILE